MYDIYRNGIKALSLVLVQWYSTLRVALVLTHYHIARRIGFVMSIPALFTNDWRAYEGSVRIRDKVVHYS